MSSCVFPGSFDPVTKGHMDLIQRAAVLYDQVTVTLMINVNKHGCIPPEKRMELLRKACADLPNVKVDRWDGLLTDYMRNNGERCILRGARDTAEFESEYRAAVINRQICPQAETLILPASPEYCAVSSSTVREIAAFGGSIVPFVPKGLAKEIGRLLSK